MSSDSDGLPPASRVKTLRRDRVSRRRPSWTRPGSFAQSPHDVANAERDGDARHPTSWSSPHRQRLRGGSRTLVRGRDGRLPQQAGPQRVSHPKRRPRRPEARRTLPRPVDGRRDAGGPAGRLPRRRARRFVPARHAPAAAGAGSWAPRRQPGAGRRDRPRRQEQRPDVRCDPAGRRVRCGGGGSRERGRLARGDDRGVRPGSRRAAAHLAELDLPALPERGDGRHRHTSTSRSGRRSSAGQPRPVVVGAAGVLGAGATPPGSARPWSSRNGG